MSKYHMSFIMDREEFSPAEKQEQRDALCPIRVINEKNKTVLFCTSRTEANNKIFKINQVAILLGFEPKKYTIKDTQKKSELELLKLRNSVKDYQ